MKNDTIPAFLTVSKAAELSGYDEADINTAIAAGDLLAADPIGKGLRIPRLSFEEWMSGAKIPPWEGKAGDWIECPLYLVNTAIRYARHPSDTYDAWVEQEHLLRIRVHATEDKMEVTWRSSNDDKAEGSDLVEFTFELQDKSTIHNVYQLREMAGQRRILQNYMEDRTFAYTPWGSVQQELTWDQLRRILRVTPRTFVPDDVQVIVSRLPSKVMGIDVARALGIMAPHAGHYRMISDALKALGWSSKRTNKGWAYFAPTFMGQVQKHFGSAEE